MLLSHTKNPFLSPSLSPLSLMSHFKLARWATEPYTLFCVLLPADKVRQQELRQQAQTRYEERCREQQQQKAERKRTNEKFAIREQMRVSIFFEYLYLCTWWFGTCMLTVLIWLEICINFKSISRNAVKLFDLKTVAVPKCAPSVTGIASYSRMFFVILIADNDVWVRSMFARHLAQQSTYVWF